MLYKNTVGLVCFIFVVSFLAAESARGSEGKIAQVLSGMDGWEPTRSSCELDPTYTNYLVDRVSIDDVDLSYETLDCILGKPGLDLQIVANGSRTEKIVRLVSEISKSNKVLISNSEIRMPTIMVLGVDESVIRNIGAKVIAATPDMKLRALMTIEGWFLLLGDVEGIDFPNQY